MSGLDSIECQSILGYLSDDERLFDAMGEQIKVLFLGHYTDETPRASDVLCL